LKVPAGWQQKKKRCHRADMQLHNCLLTLLQDDSSNVSKLLC
jgi:hypothetical protein